MSEFIIFALLIYIYTGRLVRITHLKPIQNSNP